MDLVDYEEAIFNKIKEEFISFRSLPHAYLHFIPLSALTGVNVVEIGEDALV